MKFLIALLAVALARRTLTQAEYKSKFQDFVSKFSKNYTSAFEWADRYSKFQDNVDIIIEHNAKGLSWTMGVTPFADMTPYEFTQFVKRGNGGGFVPVAEANKKYAPEVSVSSCEKVDWTTQGAVTPVKNQGQCGSCWSFSTTGAVEGRVEIAGKGLISISEQNLVDCDTTQDSGCNGGLMDYAFEYIMSNKGLCKEEDYPYKAVDQTCQQQIKCGDNKFGKISSYQDVRESTPSLQQAACDGPVAIAIEADQYAFQLYTSGVLTGTCGSNLDHGVLLVGFGTDSEYGDYWKVKNSWGAGWGDQGYIRMCRNCGKNSGAGQCGILKSASYPIV